MYSDRLLYSPADDPLNHRPKKRTHPYMQKACRVGPCSFIQISDLAEFNEFIYLIREDLQG